MHVEIKRMQEDPALLVLMNHLKHGYGTFYDHNCVHRTLEGFLCDYEWDSLKVKHGEVRIIIEVDETKYELYPNADGSAMSVWLTGYSKFNIGSKKDEIPLKPLC